MTAVMTTRATDALAQPDVSAAIDAACARIAPTWPLDRFIAVNPYWGHVQDPITTAAARLAVLSGSPLLMPPRVMLGHWQAGRIKRQHLQAAIDAAGAATTVDALVIEANRAGEDAARTLPLMTDLLDAERDLQHQPSWRDFVTQHISQRCAAFFDDSQASWPADRTGGLYATWLRLSADDMSPALLMGLRGFSRRLAALPSTPQPLIAAALRALRVPIHAHEAYLTALLLSINGWASWAAYQRWQARLVQRVVPRDDEPTVHLLAVRLAWEWLLHDSHAEAALPGMRPVSPSSTLSEALTQAWSDPDAAVARAEAAQQHAWLWQAALEHTQQAHWCQGLMQAPPMPAAAPRPAVQAVFCIDVRSEVYRRALEAASPSVQTLGFAGFFSLFVAYRPLGTEMLRPQLPGLMAPALCLTDVCDSDSDSPSLAQVLATRRRAKLQWRQLWQGFRSGAASGFSFVEACGWLYAAPLLARQRGVPEQPAAVEQTGLSAAERQTLRPRFEAAGAPSLAARADMAATALKAMGLHDRLARLVLLAGHGSSSTNNPHAAGLDCGACGGQTGEVNARALVLLLNDTAVRAALRDRGLQLPEDSMFVAGLHDTTTDTLTLHDTDLLPASHAGDVQQLRAALQDAGARARAERAPGLALAALATAPTALSEAALFRAMTHRSRDWAQVRPEWGLADCGAFIVAPRSRSRHLDLAGRSFLHDYRWQDDAGFSVLEVIMTAPMIVTHWINMQYHASVVDPLRYGSGNKVLHNVVGGHIGVFEGNGGDLRIGLPLQSVHDGQRFRHTPLRLSVFIQAPRDAMDRIIAGHDTVRHLLDNGWLHLFALGDERGVWRRTKTGVWAAEDGFT